MLQFRQQAGVPGGRNHVERRDVSEISVVPSQQRFGTADAAIGKSDFRLITQGQPIMGQGERQRVRNLPSALCDPVHALGKPNCAGACDQAGHGIGCGHRIEKTGFQR